MPQEIFTPHPCITHSHIDPHFLSISPDDFGILTTIVGCGVFGGVGELEIGGVVSFPERAIAFSHKSLV